jgi:glycyl-tRNA synthetase
MKDIISLCKRRGFIFQSSEIYGGLSSCWDYGPLGTVLKQEIKNLWFKDMLNYEEIEPLDASILMHPLVWKASGHVDHFSDPLVECNQCHKRFRQDHLEDPSTCPSCHKKDLSSPRNFNGLFKTKMGVIEDEAAEIYLRPETAQGIFVNFLNVQESMRKKIPFGIAQIGKSFRNEITPGHFIFRTREFEQMEMQYFIPPGEQKKYFELWKERRYQWILSLGIDPSSLQEKNHETLAHYADFAIDFEFKFPMGFSELEGIHSRTDFDLKSHETFSKKNLHYVDQVANKKFIPYVIETSIGCDRLLLALLCNAYKLDNERVYLDLIPKLAPKQVAIFPLVNKPPLVEPSLKIYQDLKKHYRVIFDDQGSIGKRYRRQDEIGTPYCITIDFDSLNDQSVTIRERNSSLQQRISMDKIHEFLSL